MEKTIFFKILEYFFSIIPNYSVILEQLAKLWSKMFSFLLFYQSAFRFFHHFFKNAQTLIKVLWDVSTDPQPVGSCLQNVQLRWLPAELVSARAVRKALLQLCDYLHYGRPAPSSLCTFMRVMKKLRSARSHTSRVQLFFLFITAVPQWSTGLHRVLADITRTNGTVTF